MSGPGGDQQGPPVAWIEQGVMDHVTEKVRTLDAEPAARLVGVQYEQPFAGRDQQKEPLFKRTGHCGLRMWRLRWQSIAKPGDDREPMGIAPASLYQRVIPLGPLPLFGRFHGL